MNDNDDDDDDYEDIRHVYIHVLALVARSSRTATRNMLQKAVYSQTSHHTILYDILNPGV